MIKEGVLLPYQQEWLLDDSPVKIWEKSRRIGATWCEAADAVLIASRTANPMDYYYTSVNEDLARDFIRDVASWAKSFNSAVTDMGETIWRVSSDDGKTKEDIKVRQITFNTGKKVLAIPSKAAVLRGRTGVLLADEFSFIENPGELLKAGMAFLMWGGKIRILSTHNGVDSHFNQIIKDVRAGKVNYSLHKTDLDDALEQGLYKRICERNQRKWTQDSQDKWRDELVSFYGEGGDEELFCIPTNSGGKYFPRILVENAMHDEIPVFNLTLKDEFKLKPKEEKLSFITDWLKDNLAPVIKELHPHYRTSYGFDFGRSGDLSYLVVLQELPNLVRKTAFCLELRNVPFTEQEIILFTICDLLPRFIGGANDSRGNGQSLAEKAACRYGFYKIQEVMISNPWYNEAFPQYKAALEDGKIMLPNNADLLSDHRLAETIRGIPKIPDGHNKGTDGLQRHGDGVVAFALAWLASLNDAEDCVPAPLPVSFNNYELAGF